MILYVLLKEKKDTSFSNQWFLLNVLDPTVLILQNDRYLSELSLIFTYLTFFNVKPDLVICNFCLYKKSVILLIVTNNLLSYNSKHVGLWCK